MRRALWIGLLLLAVVAAVWVARRPVPQAPVEAVGKGAQVLEVMDGDSIRVRTADARELVVRLYGVDAPEKDQPFAQQSRAFTTDATQGTEAQLDVVEIDQYGRSVAIVNAGAGYESINERLVMAGLAWRYDKHCDRESWCDAIGRREREAREARRGLWADPEPTPPWQWRWEVRQQPEAAAPARQNALPNRVCVDHKTARDPNGQEMECIPYRCEAGACLTRCRTVKDCVGEGWPMNCVNSRCVPQPPRDRPTPR